jgi:hypothetical protein
MSGIHTLAIWVKRHNLIPEGLRRFIQKHTNILDARRAWWIANDPYANDPSVSSYEPKYPYTLGIIKGFWHGHWPYIAACRDLGVAYKVLDISGPDWLEVVEQSGCDAFLVSPSVQLSIWKQMYDERLRVIANDLGRIIFPNYDEIWFYESKRRMFYWLEANGVPHPKTWVFYDLKQALDFVERAALPIVYKSDLGAGASGVRIFRDRTALRRHVKRCFKKGFTTSARCANDKEWGSILLQEYLPDAREWRIVRIGDSYFGYEKLKRGDFHSGSLQRSYSEVRDELLYFAKKVMDTGDFTSMDLDIFETSDGRYLVNELQTVFGMSRPEMCVVDGKAGRMVLRPELKSWEFEAGDFCRNHLCNLRVESLLAILEEANTHREVSS